MYEEILDIHTRLLNEVNDIFLVHVVESIWLLNNRFIVFSELKIGNKFFKYNGKQNLLGYKLHSNATEISYQRLRPIVEK